MSAIQAISACVIIFFIGASFGRGEWANFWFNAFLLAISFAAMGRERVQ